MSIEAQQLNFKLQFYKQFQTMKYIFKAWKRYYCQKSKRMRRLENIVNFFETHQENQVNLVFNAWKNSVRMRQLTNQFQLPKHINKLEIIMMKHLHTQKQNIFLRFRQMIIDKEKFIEFGHQLCRRQATVMKDKVCSLLHYFLKQQKEQTKFCHQYYCLQVQKRFFQEWSQLTTIVNQTKKLKYFAFEGRRQSLLQKSFTTLLKHYQYKKSSKQNFQLIVETKQQKLKIKYLFTWIKICVQNYQSDQCWQKTLTQKSFQVIKLWTQWAVANRNQTTQALLYNEYQTMKNVFLGWKQRTEIRFEKHGLMNQFRELLLQKFYKNLIQQWAYLTHGREQTRVDRNKADEFHSGSTLRNVFSKWNDYIEQKQSNYLNKFNSSAIYKIIQKRRLFQMWRYFLQKKNTLTINYDTLRRQNRQIKQFEILSVMKDQVISTQQKIEFSDQFYCYSLLSKPIQAMKTYHENYYQRLNQSATINNHIFVVKLVPIFYAWKHYTERHRISRYKQNISQTFHDVKILTKAYQKFKQNCQSSKKKKQIKINNENRLIMFSFKRLVQEFRVSKFIKKHSSKSPSKVFKQLKSNRDKNQYYRCCDQYIKVKRQKRLMQRTLEQLRLYHDYQERKILVKTNLVRLHYVKFMKRFFFALQYQVSRRKILQSKGLDVIFLSQFRLKKSFFKAAMLAIIGD